MDTRVLLTTLKVVHTHTPTHSLVYFHCIYKFELSLIPDTNLPKDSRSRAVYEGGTTGKSRGMASQQGSRDKRIPKIQRLTLRKVFSSVTSYAKTAAAAPARRAPTGERAAQTAGKKRERKERGKRARGHLGSTWEPWTGTWSQPHSSIVTRSVNTDQHEDDRDRQHSPEQRHVFRKHWSMRGKQSTGSMQGQHKTSLGLLCPRSAN